MNPSAGWISSNALRKLRGNVQSRDRLNSTAITGLDDERIVVLFKIKLGLVEFVKIGFKLKIKIHGAVLKLAGY
jgi:hypothetical protein